MKRFLFWLRHKYYYYVKYITYSHQEKLFLISFEQAIYARKELDSITYELLKWNIQRAKHLFRDEFEQVKVVDGIISEMSNDYQESLNEMDALDGILWKQIFGYFMLNHEDEVTANVWGAPVDAVRKFRETYEKLATHPSLK